MKYHVKLWWFDYDRNERPFKSSS